MASNTYGAIKLSTAEDVGAVLKKKTGSADGYKPKEWADSINLMGLLPIRTASGTIAHFEDGAEDVPMKSVVANIVPIQSGTGTPSPSNPRPISGTSVLNVEQRGKNILNPNSEIVPHSTYGFFPLCPNNTPLTMTLFDNDTSVDISDVSFGFSLSLTENGAQSEISNGFVWSVNSGTITGRTDNVMGGKYCDQFVFYPKTQTTLEKIFQRFNIVVSVGTTTATTYEAYNAETYTFDLGQEIMGGSADVVGGTGSKTMAKIDLGDLTWTYRSTQNCFSANINEMPLNTVLYCDIYGYSNVQYVEQLPNGNMWNRTNAFGAHSIAIKDTRFDNATDFKNAVTGYKLAYEVTTPTEYTFTGQPIDSYLGTNNLYTDSGEVLDVDYRADIDLLIAELEGNRGLQMMRATPTEETQQTEEETENEVQR